MSRKQGLLIPAKRKAKWSMRQKPLLPVLGRKRGPRDEAEALGLLKQFASETRGNHEKLFKAFRPVAKTARHAVPVWIEPLPPRIARSHLMIADAVQAYTFEKPTRRKPRARSMDVALGLMRPPGRLRGTQRETLRTAIHIHYLLLWGETWQGIADRYQIDFRTLQRIYETHSDGIVEHLSGDLFVPLGYDVDGSKLIVNEGEATTVRMIFERLAEMGSVTKLILALKAEGITGKREQATAIALAQTGSVHALIRALKAEGITGKRGKPIDEGYLYQLLNNPIYVGEAVHKGMYSGKHQAIVGRALWGKIRKILSGVT
jgi:Recombinase